MKYLAYLVLDESKTMTRLKKLGEFTDGEEAIALAWRRAQETGHPTIVLVEPEEAPRFHVAELYPIPNLSPAAQAIMRSKETREAVEKIIKKLEEGGKQ